MLTILPDNRTISQNCYSFIFMTLIQGYKPHNVINKVGCVVLIIMRKKLFIKIMEN
jgi:hypothetical protein